MAEEVNTPPAHVQLRTMLVLMTTGPKIWDEMGIPMPKDSDYSAFMSGANMIVSLLEDKEGVVFAAQQDGSFTWIPKDQDGETGE